jgi:hypothetical protein
MSKLSLPFLLTCTLVSPARIVAQTGISADSAKVALQITSAVTGMEVEFRLITSAPGPVLYASALRSSRDTVLARTPARLILNRDSVARHLALEVIAGEPWLQVLFAGQTMMEAKGSRIDIHVLQGRTLLEAASIRTWRPAF